VLNKTKQSAWRLSTLRLPCCGLGRSLEKVGNAFDPEREQRNGARAGSQWCQLAPSVNASAWVTPSQQQRPPVASGYPPRVGGPFMVKHIRQPRRVKFLRDRGGHHIHRMPTSIWTTLTCEVSWLEECYLSRLARNAGESIMGLM